jgi:3-deoxy-manno-octulosonate cytidylyltransferase (CMP-KDO synthetase)
LPVPAGSDVGSLGHNSSPRIVVVIPARYGSTRLPGKPLLDIGGRPMIEHVYRRALQAPSAPPVFVATDDERVRRAVEAFGGEARLTRSDHASGTDRAAELAEGLDCDVVVNVQGDEPFLEPAMIDEVVAPLAADRSLVMSTLRRRIDDPHEYASPDVVKVVVDGADFALYFSRAPIPVDVGGRTPASGLASKHVGIYAYRRAFLLQLARLRPTPLEQAERLEQLRALEHGFRIKAVATAYDSLGVDSADDLEQARRAVAAAARP